LEDNRKISDEMTTAIRQLVVQNQIVMARWLLRAYFVREWRVEEHLAGYYARRYCAKYYPKQLEKHLQRLSRAI